MDPEPVEIARAMVRALREEQERADLDRMASYAPPPPPPRLIRLLPWLPVLADVAMLMSAAALVAIAARVWRW